MMPWQREVDVFLRRTVSAQDRLLVAVSGGGDSMAMLALLHGRLHFGNERLVVGHVSHGIRTDDHLDAELVCNYAREAGLKYTFRKVDAPALAAQSRTSLEAAARELRYSALVSMAEEGRCRWILTGHTLDDSAETVWMRMQDGGPWYEWTAIPRRRDRILRPLLPVSRREVRDWVESCGVNYRDDETNSDRRFRRTRARAELDALEAAGNGQRKQELVKLGEMAAGVVRLNRVLAGVLPGVLLTPQSETVSGLAIDAIFIYFKSLTFLPVEVSWAKLTGNVDARLPAPTRRRVDEFLAGQGPEATMTLPEGVRLLRRGSRAWLIGEGQRSIDVPVRPGSWYLPEADATIALQVTTDGTGTRLRADLAGRSLRVRTWQPGDRLKIPGRPRKKISDLLNELRLDPAEREQTVVLADDIGPLMILGGPVDERALAERNQPEFLTVTWTPHDRDGNPAK